MLYEKLNILSVGMFKAIFINNQYKIMNNRGYGNPIKKWLKIFFNAIGALISNKRIFSKIF